MDSPDIIIRDVSKSFGIVEAVKNVSFNVGKGELFGIIGPDGAGKTTLFRLMCTLFLPDKGSITINGADTKSGYKHIRNTVGYMPGRFSLYQDLTVEENLNFFAAIFGASVKENYSMIESIYERLVPFKNRKAGALSGGMKQKLALCCALIHKPTVLFLDEPTTGVDPVSRYEFWQMLATLRKEKITMVASTPYMDEAKMCDRIALMKNGEIMNIATPFDIQRSFNGKLLCVQGENLYSLLLDVRGFDGTNSCFSFGDSLHLTLSESSPEQIAELKKYLDSKNHIGVKIEEIEPSVEDCYINRVTS